jgi:NAD(P)-dependent dehydrogenase (short-subunit alcohol dehydrogenase family)
MSTIGKQKGGVGGVRSAFNLTGRVIVITGAAGLLGARHAEAVAEMGGVPVLLDVDGAKARRVADDLSRRFGSAAIGLAIDITDPTAVDAALETVMSRFGRVDGLINNAANNPKVEGGTPQWTRLENFPLDVWLADIAVGLTGAFLCARTFGAAMARGGGGAILNVASDLALIAPDQRLYSSPGLSDDEQPVKPVSYSVVKSGLIGLTRYLCTYWPKQNVRVNAICPGGVFAGQSDEFTQRLTNLIPLGRMAREDEYQAAIVFLLSDASSYMTGAVISIDGGRTAW